MLYGCTVDLQCCLRFRWFELLSCLSCLIYLWLCWVFVVRSGLSLAVLGGLITVVASIIVEHGLPAHGCNRCSTWARELWFPGPGARAQESWGLGLAVPRRADSSRTRNRTPVSCLGWHVLGHWTPSEALEKRFSYTYTYTYIPEKEVATHSSILAWRIPRTEEPGGLQSMGTQSWTWMSD